MSEYTICLLGKRESQGSSLFIESLKIFSGEVMKDGYYTQTRTLGWPSTTGMLDKAITKISNKPILDMEIPKKYDILFLCNQYESISENNLSIFLKKGGFFIRNSTNESVHIQQNLTKISFNFDKTIPNTDPNIISFTIHKLFNYSNPKKEERNLSAKMNFSAEEDLRFEIDSFFKKELFNKIQKNN